MARTTPKLPTDAIARERLREAQAREASAVTAAYDADAALQTATARRDAEFAAAEEALRRRRAAAEEGVSRAAAAVDIARAGVADVSGTERAALLLGITKAELSRALKAAREAGRPTAAAAASGTADEG
jgi:CRP-like cAMP-binding protein